MTDFSLEQELDKAIRGEEEAANFYAEAAKRTSDPSGAAMFRELTEFEKHHREHLTALRDTLQKGGTWIAYPSRELPAAKAKANAARLSDLEHADAKTALRAAIAAEEKAEADYKALAAAISSPEGKKMFTRLAEEEALHRRLLDDQLYALSNQGVWLWGD